MVLADLDFYGKATAALHRQARATVQAVTEGSLYVDVRAVRR